MNNKGILLVCTVTASLNCFSAGRLVQTASAPEANPVLTIRSDTAAPKWDHGYPVGNGRIGILTLGAWPAGEVHGLHARGGVIVNLKWTADNVVAEIEASRDGKFQVCCDDTVKPLVLKAGESKRVKF